MVLGQHRVSRIVATVVVKDNVLLLLAAVDNFLRSGAQFVADLLNQGNDKWSDDGEDEFGELLLQLLNNLGKHRDLLNSARDALHDVIMELNGGHDLLVNVSDVDSKLLGVARGDRGVLHLRRVGVVLNLVDSGALMLVAKQTIGDLVEEVTEKAGVRGLAVLKGALELLNLVLGHLVGHWNIHQRTGT